MKKLMLFIFYYIFFLHHGVAQTNLIRGLHLASDHTL